jgi:filamentous hemagglutinin
VPVFQGSAVTGVKYTTGEPFDLGRRSDFDIAVADARLFEEAKRMGVKLRSRGTRTTPLEVQQLEVLGLDDLVHNLAGRVHRDVHLMVYGDLEVALERAGGLRLR